MALQLNTILVLHTAQVLSSPGINNLEAVSVLQLRDLVPHGSPVGRRVFRVEHHHHGPAQRRGWTRPVLGGMGRVIRPVGIVSPLVRIGRAANLRILAEGDEVFVFEDRELLVVELVKLQEFQG